MKSVIRSIAVASLLSFVVGSVAAARCRDYVGIKGTIMGISNGTMTFDMVDFNGNDHRIQVTDRTKIIRNGQLVRFEDLQNGDRGVVKGCRDGGPTRAILVKVKSERVRIRGTIMGISNETMTFDMVDRSGGDNRILVTDSTIIFRNGRRVSFEGLRNGDHGVVKGIGHGPTVAFRIRVKGSG